MKPSRENFKKHLSEKSLNIALIGMSNVGKSSRGKEMANHLGFEHFSVDQKIAQQIGLQCVSEVADWMGMPSDNHFSEKQLKYLGLEDTYTQSITPTNQKNSVLDTTGSVAHLSNKTKERLKKDFLVIYIEVDDIYVQNFIDRFFAHPKPVIWGNYFYQKPNEEIKDSIKRCYPELLNFRRKEYESLADITINIYQKSGPVDFEIFWQKVQEAL